MKGLHNNHVENINIISVYFMLVISVGMSWGSSVSIVSDYRLDDWVSISGRGKGYSSSLCFQISSEVHPVFYPMGPEG
jgi:hypothetical protein